MAEAELVRKWLEKAEQDFGYAASSLEEELEYFPQICWHFQQSAEKFLKSYIIAFDLDFKKIHDLLALLKTCATKDAAFNSLADECKYLQKFYIETRYPVVWETKWSRTDALNAQLAAEKISELVKSRLQNTL